MYIMIGLVVAVVLTIWVSQDAYSRGHRDRGGWIIGTLLLPIVFFPLYMAKRPLRPGETRQGGKGWNFCKYLALLLCLWGVIDGFIGGIEYALTSQTQVDATAGSLGFALGTTAGWLILAGVVLLIGLIPRNIQFVEYGSSPDISSGPASPMTQTNGIGFQTSTQPARTNQSTESVYTPHSRVDNNVTATQSQFTGPQRSNTKTGEADVYGQIRHLAELRDEGLIEAEDYEAKKQELLKRI